jgi:hypothetical protein
MAETQIFVWGTDQKLAVLEVRHRKSEMLLNVDATFAEKVRTEMGNLNIEGLYPNEETTRPGGKFAQFIIAVGDNWDFRYKALLTILSTILGVSRVEDPCFFGHEPKNGYGNADRVYPERGEYWADYTCKHCGEKFTKFAGPLVGK